MKTRHQQQREHHVRKTLAKAINAFSKGFFSQRWELLSALEDAYPTEKDLTKIHKVLNLLILGEFFGHHHLCQLLDAFHLSTHHLYRLWSTCTNEQRITFVNGFLWLAFQIHQLTVPNLFLSVDNGCCDLELFEADDEITVISVPKKSWIFEIDGQKMSLKQQIDRLLEEERTSQTPVFPLRKRAVGNTLGEVVLLFFRFNTSTTVSDRDQPTRDLRQNIATAVVSKNVD